ncbi:hypothetical protein QAD02_007337 [Eretmocerus hayati]|uniref:Uncharacterized protein n=1 Tax=Eretmocerus hayati TaxID=131215 RepID=A0ACC2N3C4_9HYME|nr:hypothetical protein QAD02_007337 [Eretmocerus hayati]
MTSVAPKCSYSYKDLPGNSLKCTFDGTLKELVANCKPKTKKIFYQQHSIHVNELENKKQFKCLWVGPSLREEKEIILYPNKCGTVANLLEEARKYVDLSEDGSGKLRILEVVGNKLQPGPREDVSLETLSTNGSKIYRIEEIPRDEMDLSEDELLVPVAHFHKDIFSTFGIPFLFKVKQGEPFMQMKERLFKRLGIQEKEFEKYKFAIVSANKAHFINESPDYSMDVSDFKPHQSQDPNTEVVGHITPCGLHICGFRPSYPFFHNDNSDIMNGDEAGIVSPVRSGGTTLKSPPHSLSWF